MPTVVIEDQGDCWWDAPDRIKCDVCWGVPAAVDGLPRQYWLLRLHQSAHDPSDMADFNHVLVMHTGHDLNADRPFVDYSVPMYPLLRPIEPGGVVSFDGDLLAGVKATIRGPGEAW